MANLTKAPLRERSRAISSFLSPWDDPFDMIDQFMRFGPRWLSFPNERQSNLDIYVPKFDVKETKDRYIFRADLPGFREEEIDISLTGNRLTISGKREVEDRDEDENYFISERSQGSFQRSFTLPETADVDRMAASMKDGVLEMSIPKRPDAKPRKISLRQGPKNIAGGSENNRSQASEGGSENVHSGFSNPNK